MANLFNEKMSFIEAQHTFFQAIDGKSKEEMGKIKAQFDSIIPIITKNELNQGAKGWL